MNEHLHIGEATDHCASVESEAGSADVTELPDLATTSLARKAAERGASLVEYALLLALIAIVCFAAIGALGQSTTEPYSDLTSGIAQS